MRNWCGLSTRHMLQDRLNETAAGAYQTVSFKISTFAPKATRRYNTMSTAWFYLILAGICEIGWAFGLKYSEGFTKPTVSIVTVLVMILSFVLLAQAMKSLPLGTAYAIWTGIGAAGTAILGMFFLNEPKDVMRILCLVMIVAGVVGLKYFAESN